MDNNERLHRTFEVSDPLERENVQYMTWLLTSLNEILYDMPKIALADVFLKEDASFPNSSRAEIAFRERPLRGRHSR